MANEVTPASIKALREKTGAGMMECKSALTEAEGDENKAIDVLRKRGLVQRTKKRVGAAKRCGCLHSAGGKNRRPASKGNCETICGAHGALRTRHDLAMHIPR